jgi:hypothetical protein
LSVALTPVEEDDTTVALGKEPRVKAQGSYLPPFSRLEGQLPSAIKPQKGAQRISSSRYREAGGRRRTMYAWFWTTPGST